MRKYILVSMLLVPVLPFALSLGIGYYYFTSSLEHSTLSGLERVVEDHRQMIEYFLSERRADLELVLNSYTYEEIMQPARLQDILKHLQNKSNAFTDLGIFNAQGVHLAYCGPYKLTGKVYKQEYWFMEVMKNGYYISDVFLGFRRLPHFIIAVSRQDENQRWVLRAAIDTYFFNNLVEKVRIGKTGEAYILSSEKAFQTNRRSGGELMETDPDQANYSTSYTGVKTFINSDLGKGKYLYATTWLKNKNWLLVVRQEKADAFNALRSAAYLIILISVIGGTIIFIVALYLTDRIVNRMEQMGTEKERLEQQLIGASRLAELGEMAAGFAHEINNPLQIIKSEKSLVEILLSELSEKYGLKDQTDFNEVKDALNQIQVQVERCAKITQAILKFGRQSEPALEEIDLKRFIPGITAMIAKKASVQGISISQGIQVDTPKIHGDPAQLQQVLMNLYNNAMEAIVDLHGVAGGKLKINAQGEGNDKISISVSDNGSGISPENQNKIFTPFFTTKAVGKGTGLGLSVCYGIIDHMGGTMDVESEKGIGTTFTIKLPAIV